MTTEPSWGDRLSDECRDLGLKLEKLSAFIGSSSWSELPYDHREMLVEQRNHMTAYHGILRLRLAAINEGR